MSYSKFCVRCEFKKDIDRVTKVLSYTTPGYLKTLENVHSKLTILSANKSCSLVVRSISVEGILT